MLWKCEIKSADRLDLLTGIAHARFKEHDGNKMVGCLDGANVHALRKRERER